MDIEEIKGKTFTKEEILTFINGYINLFFNIDKEVVYKEDYDMLQNKINKAIEYIKENAWYDYRDNEEVITIPKEKLLDILQGDDKE